MNRYRQFTSTVAILALLSACGGDDDQTAIAPPSTPPISAPPPATVVGCSLRERQDFALAQLREFYLFPELLDLSVSPANYSTVQAYIDALVAPARAQNRDRFFTYITSIAEENAFFNSGSTAGFGIRLTSNVAEGRVTIAETFEGTPALAAGIDRGTEILAIGTSATDLVTVRDLLASGGSGAVTNALGPGDPGLTRVLRVRDKDGTVREVTLSKAKFNIDPVSDRYGALIINDNGKKVGYVNLRVFIGAPAESDLRAAFARFKAEGITEVIVDLRYNGGGLVSIAELLTNLLLGQRSSSDVQSFTVFRPEKAVNNETTFFMPQPESISATKIAFITTGSSASASELVANAVLPYLGSNAALIGSDTFGKPVGQIAIDRAQCDDRLRILAFATQNANRQGDYFDGLASKFDSTCRAPDDLSNQLGEPQEASIMTALDFLAGRACTPIGTIGTANTQGFREDRGRSELIKPAQPKGTVERDLPGAY
ncbi:peptidase S41 [Altererythrobacter sp. SALINAS58]|uniref:S41 family peptidase n=1 Tax=Alteripontixanthobacter muriae TaxID=2705546 RepID=UPI001575C9E0|nr:S41 family peptidase [Alteripontixanthobacter muriae]NTZ43851.1 peptidase S41 [Alteripontixanthobacter muriae]